MPRASRRKAPALMIRPSPVFLETDLEGWAGRRIALSGRQNALLSRVDNLRLSAEGNLIEARVRDSGPLAYRVCVVVQAGLLVSQCNCPFDWGPVCKHAVAAVEALRFPRSFAVHGRGGKRQAAAHLSGWALAREERVVSARQEALAERKQRARRAQAKVRSLPRRGGPPRFLVGQDGTRSTVFLRGARLQLGSCTCTDFARNELASCEHIERARAWFRRRRKRLATGLCSVWACPREWPAQVPDPLREIRVERPDGDDIADCLRGHFDDDGWLETTPQGISDWEWARRAVEVTHGLCQEHGWKWDLDPVVESRIETARAAEEAAKRLSRADETWIRVRAGLRMELHPYQVEGVRFLSERARAFLADDMGLGKTVQAVAAALVLRETAGAVRALVVCPASIKHQWREEIAKACGETAVVIEGARAARLAAYRDWRHGFLVLNYELVLRDIEIIRGLGAELVILDEAQRIKNWSTKTAMAVKRLESPHAFVLTGTPLENRLPELHSIVEFLHSRALGPRWRLLPFHAATDSEGRVLAYEDLDVLRGRLRPLFLRREREQVLDQLPERIDNTFWTGMTSAQWRPYRRQAARIASLLSRRRALGPSEARVVLQALTSMRILCNAYAQHAWPRFERRVLEGGATSPADVRTLHSPKLEEFARVLEDLLEASDTKIVVFSQWERMLRLARYVAVDLLARRGERAEFFHGSLDTRARRRVLGCFRDDPDLRVLFSTDAGGLGLNLQESASVVVNLEVPWNPAVLEQRVSRVHRLGQRRPVQVLHFVTAGAIEERVREVVGAKRALFDGLLVDEADRIVVENHGRAIFAEDLGRLIAG